MSGHQPDLFGPPAETPAHEPPADGVEAAAVDDELRELGAALPAGVRIGTSSWSFPGWAGIVYAKAASAQRLARAGLAAYARHPLLRTVGVDRGYYAPLERRTFADYAAAVPDDFRFLVKAPERLTVARFPRHARYGAEAGLENLRFLDPGFARELVVEPMLAGLGRRAGPLVFQFPPQDVAAAGGPRGFARRLHAFLDALPDEGLYAVEIRNRALFGDDYLGALADTGAVHCINQHPSMPSPAEQAARVRGLAGPLVVRWMLGDGKQYESAREQYAPFDRLVEPAPRVRAEVASLVVAATELGEEAHVVINNKAEGSAPLSAVELAREIRRQAGG